MVRNGVDDVFVEDAFISEAPEEELEGFEFNTQLVRDVIDVEGGEIWLGGHRA